MICYTRPLNDFMSFRHKAYYAIDEKKYPTYLRELQTRFIAPADIRARTMSILIDMTYETT